MTSPRKPRAARPRPTAPAITAAARRALDAALHAFGGRPDVTGVDLGFRIKGGEVTGELCVRIHVREKVARDALSAAEAFPARIHGIPVDVVQAQYQQAKGDAPADRFDRCDVIQPGISVGHALSSAGTLGMMVADAKTGAPGILSVAHVIFPDGAQPGDPVTQPGRADGGFSPHDTIARLGRFDGATDSAVAWLDNQRPWDAELFGSTTTLSGLRPPTLGDVLTKSGRTTAETQGLVDGVSGSYGGAAYGFHLVPTPGTHEPISLDGDSGAVWFHAPTRAAVGLHCRGPAFHGTATSYAVATNLARVFQRLRLKGLAS